ncbi:hypothetical protein J4Q44_G00214430 [Coregonus suidteri]|uniref:Uncharacterized protein n=1 Tax=Coregonus suidteri TaxID=861788 RepID=A0AAN8LGN9_9TELE
MLLQYIHIIFLPHDAIYFVKCTSPSCSKAPPQHDAATPVLHIWDGVRLASIPLFLILRLHFSHLADTLIQSDLQLVSAYIFPPNITMDIMAKQFYFCFIRPEDISPKSMIFVPMCSCKP